MSQAIWHRRGPAGYGLEKLAAVVRDPASASALPIPTPPEDVDQIKAQGIDGFTFASFTVEDAHELGYLLQARLTPFAAESRPTLISISLTAGTTIFQVATGPGTAPDNETWVARKRASVLRFGVSTWLMHCKFGGDESLFASKFGMGPEQAGKYAIHGGAVPIRIKGVEGVVAVVIVSGLKQHEDHGVIVDVIRENWEAKDA